MIGLGWVALSQTTKEKLTCAWWTFLYSFFQRTQIPQIPANWFRSVPFTLGLTERQRNLVAMAILGNTTRINSVGCSRYPPSQETVAHGDPICLSCLNPLRRECKVHDLYVSSLLVPSVCLSLNTHNPPSRPQPRYDALPPPVLQLRTLSCPRACE